MGGFVGFFKNKIFSLTTIFVSFSMVSTLAHATLSDNVIGSYAGTVQYDETACSGPPVSSSETAATTMTITKLAANSFNGNGIISFSDGEKDALFLDIAGTTTTTFFFTWTETGIGNPFSGSGSGTGSITPSGDLTISGTGSESGGSLCSLAFSGTLNKASGDTISSSSPSTAGTEGAVAYIQAQQQSREVSNAAIGWLHGNRSNGLYGVQNQFKLEGAAGLNAGDGATTPYGVWGSYSYSDYDNDLSSTAFDGDTHSFLGGIDFGFWENTVMGVAFGYDNGDIDTTFNGGHQDSDTYTIVPYFAALLTDTLSLDFNIGYSYVDYDQFRTLSGTTTRVSSSPDADRWFGALNLNGLFYHDNWIFGTRVGALWTKSVIDSFTESNGSVVAESRSKAGTVVVGGDVAYSYNNFEPFVNLSYQYDFQLREISVTTGPQPANDDDDILMTAGVRYYNDNGISGNLEYTKRFERDNFDEDRISLIVRGDF